MIALMILAVTAQAGGAPDVLSGSAGYLGTGLLGSVLAWVFFVNLPGKDKQIASLIESRDALVRELTAAHQETVKSIAADFRAAVSDQEKRAAEADRDRRHDFRDQLQAITTRGEGQLSIVTKHCEAELSLTNQAIRRDLDELNATLADQRSMSSDVRAMVAEVRGNMSLFSKPIRPTRPGQQPPPPKTGA
jgi:hypothetical protein